MENFKIYLDQVSHGHTTLIDENVSPSFLKINEKELKFLKPVIVKGKSYITEEMLIFHLDISTSASMPCSICNEFCDFEIYLKNFYFTEELGKINSAFYDYGELVREAILLQIPLNLECNNGKCPERNNVSLYLKKNHMNFPFADLDKKK